MLQIGFGAADITPDIGMDIPGGFGRTPAQGVRDRLFATACVVHDGKTPVALVGTDTLVVARATVEEARRTVQKATRLPGENILLGASHTHSGGPAAAGLGREEDPIYLKRLADGIVGAVTAAWNSLHAAEIGVGVGREDSISFNRRFLMRNGREITHPGKPGTLHHAEVVRPAGPIDPDVGVLAARDPKGNLAGVVVNFACHNTVVGGNTFSADYAGRLRKQLQVRYGDTFPVVFLLGACGDITQVDNQSTARESGPEYADLMEAKLAAEVVRTVGRMTWLKEAATAAWTETAVLHIRPDPDVGRERPPFGLGSGERVEPVYARWRNDLAELRKKTPTHPAEVQAIRVGPLGIVANGSEYFCEYALRIKACSPFRPTWVVSLANEHLGYVPTAQAFVAGGYEPRTGRSSRYSIDAGQRLLETSLKVLARVAV